MELLLNLHLLYMSSLPDPCLAKRKEALYLPYTNLIITELVSCLQTDHIDTGTTYDDRDCLQLSSGPFLSTGLLRAYLTFINSAPRAHIWKTVCNHSSHEGNRNK
jgi:hypothetical protein